jgi:hypothetical protein
MKILHKRIKIPVPPVLKRFVNALVAFTCHSVMLVLLLLGVKIVEWVYLSLYGEAGLSFYGRFPLSYLIDTIDLFLFAVFGIGAIIDVVRALMGYE